MNRISRRRFAAGLGAGLLAAPFLGRMSQLRADGGTARNLVIFFSPNGTHHHLWRPTGSGSSFSFPAGSILEPLAAHKSDLIICDGIDFKGVDNHEPGMINMLTGGGNAGSASRGQSVDWYVAQELGVRPVNLGIYTSPWGTGAQTRMSYSAAGQFAPVIDEPRTAYNQIFDGFTGNGGSTGAGGGEIDPKMKRRQSILRVTNGEMDALRAGVPAREQAKLDAHIDGLKQIAPGASTGVGPVAASCGTAPPPPPSFNPTDEDAVPDIAVAQMDLVAAALACGRTRVATVQFSHTVSPLHLRWLGLSSQDHHSLSHASSGEDVDRFRIAERWFAEQFAYLLKKLKSTAGSGGGTLLDETLVVWAKELGDAPLHRCESVPFVLAGGGAFTPGRYIKFGGAPHQQLLVSICQAMGLSNSTFGDASKGTGPLDGLA
ncbi:DUF1552 domain-containing protein [Sorangium sp. So ce341]|uniref:DUF1552 domain-containing protein n=1 Tax=Sorangium sp. So ce341 TaxID=3133302 RepID=UPI003F5DAE6E